MEKQVERPENILANLVRIGTVYAVDDAKRKARVRFKDKNLTSGWLPVLRSPPFIPAKGVTQQTETQEGHKHDLNIKPWMPEIDDVVLCLYLPTWNGDGFILGAI